MPKVHFNARDCAPLATCLEKHGLCVFPYVRKGVCERVLQERTTTDDEVVLELNEVEWKVVLELSVAEWKAVRVWYFT